MDPDSEAPHAAQGVDLNTCPERDIAALAGLGSERARRLVAARPLESWDDVRRLEGFDDRVVHALAHAGARIGGRGGGGDRPGREHAQ
jgi:DNA uptake protein ComE-like DNA-binding protein